MDATPLEWIATGSYERDPDSHGDLTLGLRKGPFSAVVRTERPEIRWSPSDEHGHSWLSLHGHVWASRLIHAPWADGAPAPERAISAPSIGLDAGTARHAGHGFWYGGRAGAEYYLFQARPETTIAVPDPRLIATVDLLAGRWLREFEITIRAGLDWSEDLQPHIAADLHWGPRWLVAPRLEVWAGAAERQDFVTRTRMGGLSPWAVPLAGAGWGELWVEDYVVARVGPTVGVEGFRAGPFVDLAAWDDDATTTFGAGGRFWRGRFYVEAAGGYAPWIERQEGVSRLAAWASVGFDWGHGWTPADDLPAGPNDSVWPR